MYNRRNFLSSLSIMAASALLTACGGDNKNASSQISVSNSVNNASPDGTSIPPASSIIDSTGATWTVENEVIYYNGTADTRTYNVTLLLWFGQNIYHQGSNDQFYIWLNSGWLACTNPLTQHANINYTPGMFYGVNGHYDYNMYSASEIVTILQALGCSSYRLSYENNQASLDSIINIAKAFQTVRMTLLVCIDFGVTDGNGNLWSSEQNAYNNAYESAELVAKALSPYGIIYFECGNENTRNTLIINNSAYVGTQVTDFNNTNWPILRGVSRGLRDGIKSVLPNALCGMNFCVGDIAASDMLWFGQQPDGTSGYPTVKWDITTWHNYEVYGDIFNMSYDGDGATEPHFNLPAFCKAKYGVPFIITEWSANPEVSQSDRATYITQKMTDYYNNRKAQTIDSIMYYELDSGNTTWGLIINGVPNTEPYNAMKNFIASNPDT